MWKNETCARISCKWVRRKNGEIHWHALLFPFFPEICIVYTAHWTRVCLWFSAVFLSGGYSSKLTCFCSRRSSLARSMARVHALSLPYLRRPQSMKLLCASVKLLQFDDWAFTSQTNAQHMSGVRDSKAQVGLVVRARMSSWRAAAHENYKWRWLIAFRVAQHCMKVMRSYQLQNCVPS